LLGLTGWGSVLAPSGKAATTRRNPSCSRALGCRNHNLWCVDGGDILKHFTTCRGMSASPCGVVLQCRCCRQEPQVGRAMFKGAAAAAVLKGCLPARWPAPHPGPAPDRGRASCKGMSRLHHNCTAGVVHNAPLATRRLLVVWRTCWPKLQTARGSLALSGETLGPRGSARVWLAQELGQALVCTSCGTA
jgi:hypothetical protein